MNTRSKIMVGAIIVLSVLLPVMLLGQGGGSEDRSSERSDQRRYAPVPPAVPNELLVRRTAFLRFPGTNEKETMAFVGERFPRRMLEYRKLVEIKPDAAVDLLTDLVAESVELLEVKAANPPHFGNLMRERDLKRLAARKALDAKHQKGAEKDKTIAELEQILAQSFEVRQNLMEEDIAGIERELGQLKNLVKQRESKRREIIARRVDELTGDSPRLGW